MLLSRLFYNSIFVFAGCVTPVSVHRVCFDVFLFSPAYFSGPGAWGVAPTARDVGPPTWDLGPVASDFKHLSIEN